MKAAFDRTQVTKYLIFTFGAAYAVQVGAYFLYKNVGLMAARCALALMMFVPLLGVLSAGYSLKGMGWKPVFRGHMKTVLTAWFAPAILTALGAGLYFLIFPQHFDLSGAYVTEIAGAEALQQMKAQGLSYPGYVLISIAGCLTYAPLMNTVVALGEEVGWRGFLYPQLKAKYGVKKGWVLGGIIWGAWHFPVIWLIGYEYGFDYVGFPVAGMLLFAVVTVALGILEDWVYEKTQCIWVPALFHGAFNAAVTIPSAVTAVDTGSARLLGSAPNGLIAGIPVFLFAMAVFLRYSKEDTA